MWQRFLLAGFVLVASVGCVTDSGRQEKKAPPITQDMSTDDAVEAALEFGGETLDNTKTLIKKRREAAKVSAAMEKKIIDGAGKAAESEVINAMHLYLVGADKASIAMFERLMRSEREIDRILGWNLAANMPSKEVSRAMDQEFTRRISAGEEKMLLLPQMASAVQANRLTSAYTMLRYGLMEKGDDSYAKAMISIAPSRAGEDFLPYLAKASIEELRQLNQTSVNVYTCLVILRYFTVNPVPVAHRDFPQIFLYSVSRNQGLAEVAAMVLDNLMPQYKEILVTTLVQQPAWIQMAFVEDAKRRKTPNLAFFLSELKDLTVHEEVSQEIEEL